MKYPDTAISSVLRKSQNSYFLARVGSSSFESPAVISNDIDYFCVNLSIPEIMHEAELRRMKDELAKPAHIHAGFSPRWAHQDAEFRDEIVAKLCDGYVPHFSFGPIPSSQKYEGKTIIHFSGPLSYGDYRLFAELFPIFAYIFYYSCRVILPERGSPMSARRPTDEEFIEMINVNLLRASFATTDRVREVALQKIFLLRSFWLTELSPYEHSRAEAKKWGSESPRCFREVEMSPIRFLRDGMT